MSTSDQPSNFGETVPGYSIRVLNEREIRAAAGILFLFLMISFAQAGLKQNFVPIKYFITLFFFDFVIRLFISPKFSPTLILGRLVVRNQTPEYVGAKQKKVAWTVGLLLSFIMLIHIAVFSAASIVTGLICMTCLIFLFFESSFGICLACKMYSLIYKDKVQYCPGEVCDPKTKSEIQKTSSRQIGALLAFVLVFMVCGYFLFPHYSLKTQLIGPGPEQTQN